MGEVLLIYRNIILEFLFELYVFYVLTTWKLSRAPRFWLKAVGGLCGVLAVALGAAWFYRLWGDTVLGRSAVYLLLFAVTIAHVKLCFTEYFPTVLFCCSVAYAAQNLCYKLYLLVWCGWLVNVSDSWGLRFDLYYRLTYYLIFAAAVAAVYVFFIRRVVWPVDSWQLDQQLLAISLIILVITAILCSVEDIYFARLSVGRENQFDMVEYFVLRQSGNLISVMCCMIVLLLASRTVEQRELRQEVAYLQHAVRQSQRQYEISRDTIELINVKCHDIRYRLSSLAAQGGQVSPGAVEDIRKSVAIYDAKIETGNRLLDVLLTEKSLYCEQNGIKLSCMADGEKLSFMEDSDLYCLFGNVLDNALEAVKCLEQRERRVIDLSVRARGGMLIIQEENYFAGDLAFQDGLPMTTKADKDYHGFGMRSIRMIVHKYKGELNAYASDGVFHLNILFSAGDF